MSEKQPKSNKILIAAIVIAALAGTGTIIGIVVTSPTSPLNPNGGGSGISIYPRTPILKALDSIYIEGKIPLDWDYSSSTDYYEVYRQNAAFDSIEGLQPITRITGHYYEDKLPINGIYYYRVTATNEHGTSPLSNQVSTKFDLNVPPPGGYAIPNQYNFIKVLEANYASYFPFSQGKTQGIVSSTETYPNSPFYTPAFGTSSVELILYKIIVSELDLAHWFQIGNENSLYCQNNKYGTPRVIWGLPLQVISYGNHIYTNYVMVGIKNQEGITSWYMGSMRYLDSEGPQSSIIEAMQDLVNKAPGFAQLPFYEIESNSFTYPIVE